MKILIDCGHFAKQNPSTVCAGYYEGDQMWKLGQLLAEELARRGATVGQTRKSLKSPLSPDVHADVRLRGEAAKGYDVMISLHSNAAGTSSPRRVVVIHYLDASKDDKTFAQNLGDVVKMKMGIGELTQLYTRSLPDNPNREYYGVLRAAKETAKCSHAFIIEHSFHTNALSARWLMDDGNLKQLAVAEAELIMAHFGEQTKSVPVPTTSGGISVGDVVMIEAGATYKGGKPVPGMVRPKPYTVSRVADGYALLKEIYSWVDIPHLTIVL